MNVEDVRPGDEVLVHPQIGRRVVSKVDEYPEGTFVVVYFATVENSWENRARDKGRWNAVSRLCERALVPKRASDLLDVKRGRQAAAETLRGEMLSAQAERWAELEQRQARQAARREAAAA